MSESVPVKRISVRSLFVYEQNEKWKENITAEQINNENKMKRHIKYDAPKWLSHGFQYRFALWPIHFTVSKNNQRRYVYNNKHIRIHILSLILSCLWIWNFCLNIFIHLYLCILTIRFCWFLFIKCKYAYSMK